MRCKPHIMYTQRYLKKVLIKICSLMCRLDQLDLFSEHTGDNSRQYLAEQLIFSLEGQSEVPLAALCSTTQKSFCPWFNLKKDACKMKSRSEDCMVHFSEVRIILGQLSELNECWFWYTLQLSCTSCLYPLHWALVWSMNDMVWWEAFSLKEKSGVIPSIALPFEVAECCG